MVMLEREGREKEKEGWKERVSEREDGEQIYMQEETSETSKRH